MKKPIKPEPKGNKAQLIQEQIGYLDFEYNVPKVRLNWWGLEERVNWPSGFRNSESLLIDIGLAYLSLDKYLKERGYIKFYFSGDLEEASLYAFRMETDKEITERLTKESNEQGKYETELANYQDWLNKELNDFNK